MLFGPRLTHDGHKPDPIRGELTIALQANERASNNARAAILEAFSADKMTATLGDIVGKM